MLELGYSDYNPFCASNRDPGATGNDQCDGVQDKSGDALKYFKLLEQSQSNANKRNTKRVVKLCQGKKPLLCSEINELNKQKLSEIDLFEKKSYFLNVKIIVYTDLCQERNITTPLLKMNRKELDQNLARFYVEARTKKGEEYSRSALLGFRNSIERHLNNNGVTVKI